MQSLARPVRGSFSGRACAFPRLLWVVVLALVGCAGAGLTDASDHPPVVTGRPVLAGAYRPTGRATAGDTFVQLFEWYWPDVAAECGRALGPAGYRAALVSPPQEHNVYHGDPWSMRYGPVSYSIDRTQGGTRAQFVDMVERCRAAGVDIYADAVINHMAPGSGVGSNGTAYTRYNYAPLYAPSDFHPACTLSNYQSAGNVQDCELLGLPDLNTGSDAVQQKIADYLVMLTRLGVAGFRIDAAKHIQPVELDGIVARVNRAIAGDGRAAPFFFLEVIDPGTEAVHASDYYGLGYATGGAADITEFRFTGVGNKFSGANGERASQLTTFAPSTWQLMPADKAVVFLENHDTQRAGGIGYRDGDAYRLANVWMLGQPYGYPVVMSSYAFDRGTQGGRDAGPPAPASAVSCAARMEAAVIGQWVCEHRDPWVVAMVGFRRAVAGADFSRMWEDGADAVAYSRGDKGWVAINNGASGVSATIMTGLAAGTYCDVLSGSKAGASCTGRSITAAADGSVTITLGARSAVAMHSGQRL